MSSANLDATAATVGAKNVHEQPDADVIGTGAPQEVAKGSTLRVNNPSGDGNSSAENCKALPEQEPPKHLVSHDKSDQNPAGEESNVATKFYSLSPAALCEIAFKGLDSLRDKFKETWTHANISGSVIVDDLTVSTLDQMLRELECNSTIKIHFTFQRTKIMQNIAFAISEDTTIDENVRNGWSEDLLIYLDAMAPQIQTPVIRQTATPVDHSSSNAKIHTPISGSRGVSDATPNRL